MDVILAFIWGATGGLSVEFMGYLQKVKNGDYECKEQCFKTYHLLPCIFYFMIGGLVSVAIVSNPTESWAFIIGMGASSFVAKFVPK